MKADQNELNVKCQLHCLSSSWDVLQKNNTLYCVHKLNLPLVFAMTCNTLVCTIWQVPLSSEPSVSTLDRVSYYAFVNHVNEIKISLFHFKSVRWNEVWQRESLFSFVFFITVSRFGVVWFYHICNVKPWQWFIANGTHIFFTFLKIKINGAKNLKSVVQRQLKTVCHTFVFLSDASEEYSANIPTEEIYTNDQNAVLFY